MRTCKDKKKNMKSFKDWKEEREGKSEGVNPTDIDSAGMDQDLDNVGVPFDLEAAEKTALVDRERDEIDRDYQRQLFNKMFQNMPDNDPNDIDVTKGPQGETKGGIVDSKIRSYLMDKLEKEKARQMKSRNQREKINVKMTSTFFRQDQDSSRDDTGVVGGNADKHSIEGD